MVLVMTFITGLHNLSFFPDKSFSQKAVAKDQWTVTHVLGAGCKCSQIIFEHLLNRGVRTDVLENVIIVGDMKEEARRLQEKGFQVLAKDARTLASEKAVGVPFMLVNSPRGDTVYAGGYANGFVKKGTPILDAEIIASVKGGKVASELPIFGCAVSQRIKSLIDPLGLKYKESVQ